LSIVNSSVNKMKQWTINYFKETDILWFGRPARENRYEEPIPGVRIEFDKDNKVIGVEITGVKKLLGG